MTRIDDALSESASEGRLALNTYLVAGYPSYETSLDAILAVVDSGADMIELGIPYSDPIADGEILQAASKIALEHGITPCAALRLAKEARRLVEVPILMMTYYNPVLQYGLERFCSDCQANGIDGLLVPDLPVEESEELLGFARDVGLNLVYFLSLNSPIERIKLTATVANGFVYLFSLLGVTGERNRVDPALPESVKKVRQLVRTPICVGFGISSPQQVHQIKGLGVDGLVVGSGIVRRLDEGLGSVRSFVSSLKEAC